MPYDRSQIRKGMFLIADAGVPISCADRVRLEPPARVVTLDEIRRKIEAARRRIEATLSTARR